MVIVARLRIVFVSIYTPVITVGLTSTMNIPKLLAIVILSPTVVCFGAVIALNLFRS